MTYFFFIEKAVLPGNNSSSWIGAALSWGILGGWKSRRQKPRGLWLSVVVSAYQWSCRTCVNTHMLLPELFAVGELLVMGLRVVSLSK